VLATCTLFCRTAQGCPTGVAVTDGAPNCDQTSVG
jgi:hypothetical protein